MLLALILVASSIPPATAYDYRTGANSPQLYSPNGTYLGNFNSNQYDPNSISNPYGKYGSSYSPNSVNNPYGQYGNPDSSQYSNPYGKR